MRISLVAHIPDQAVARRVEHIVDGRGQFDYAQARAEVAAGLGDDIDRFAAKFIGQLTKFRLAEPAHIRRNLDPV